MLMVDRFEREWAVLEWEGRTFTIPRALLPQGAREGDCLRWTLEIDRAATTARRERVRALLERLEE